MWLTSGLPIFAELSSAGSVRTDTTIKNDVVSVSNASTGATLFELGFVSVHGNHTNNADFTSSVMTAAAIRSPSCSGRSAATPRRRPARPDDLDGAVEHGQRVRRGRQGVLSSVLGSQDSSSEAFVTPIPRR